MNQKIDKQALLDAAINQAESGISVIFTDGNKHPVGKWKPNQSKIATPDDLRRSVRHPKVTAVAGVCGAVSGGLELYDFDNKRKCVFNAWSEQVKSERPELHAKLPTNSSPSGGFHIWVRYEADTYEGSQKLAEMPNPDYDPNDEEKRKNPKTLALIETRGEGGYGLRPPSKGYEPIQGNRQIPVITQEEREYLITTSRAFDEMNPQPETSYQQSKTRSQSGISPGDDFNQRTEWRAFIESLGFTVTRLTSDRAYLTRPGKDSKDGHSAVFAIQDFTENGKTVSAGHLYNFSSNTPHLEPKSSYDLFGLYARFKHNGNFEAATKALAAQGYGTPRKRAVDNDQWGTIDAPGHAHYEDQDTSGNDEAKEQAKIEREVQRLTRRGQTLWAKRTTKKEIRQALLDDNRLNLDESFICDIVETIAPSLKPTSARTVMTTEYAEPNWAIEGMIPEGLTVFAGPSKIGKSWMVLNWGTAIATGGIAMNSIPVEQGRVLYAALEDNERRLSNRLKLLLPDGTIPDGLDFLTLGEMPMLDQGGLSLLEEYLEVNPDTKVVIIDTWKKVKPRSNGKANMYDEDYEMLGLLQQFAMGKGIALIVVHHTRKGADPDNVWNEMSGSSGVQAPCDGMVILRRTAGNFSLNITGRDVDEQEYAVAFEAGHWSLLGDAFEHRMSEQRQAIIGLLRENEGNPQEKLTPSRIATLLGMKKNNIDQLLYKMRADGLVYSDNGIYAISDKSDKSSKSDKRDKSDKSVPPEPETYQTYQGDKSTDKSHKPSETNGSGDSLIGLTGLITNCKNESDGDKLFLDSWWESWENTPMLPRNMVGFAQGLGIDLAAKCFAENGVSTPTNSVYQILVHLQSVAEAYGYRVERYESPYGDGYGKWQLKQRELFDEVTL